MSDIDELEEVDPGVFPPTPHFTPSRPTEVNVSMRDVMSAHGEDIDEKNEVYDPRLLGGSFLSMPTASVTSLRAAQTPSSGSLRSLPGASASFRSLPDDFSVSKVQLQKPTDFVVDRDSRDIPVGHHGFEVGASYGNESRDPRDAAHDSDDLASLEEQFRHDTAAISELQHRIPTFVQLDEETNELQTMPDTVVTLPVKEDGSEGDGHVIHCWGRLSRRIRTVIIMFSVTVILLLLIIGILFPVGGSTKAQSRVFYIAAEQSLWDYLPSEADLLFGENGPIPDVGKIYTVAGSNRIGHSYIKARYRRYSDSTFTTIVTENDEEAIGLLGPTIYCQVGDEITIHFKNNLNFPTNIHAQGVTYGKDSEAWSYGPHAAQEASPLVMPGETREYTWSIPAEAGPEAADGLSVAWLYYPGQNAVADWNSGLIGFIVVTRDQGAKPDGSPSQAAKNFPLLFAIFDENLSPFLDSTAEETLGVQWSPALKADPDFQESNRMASINGRMYANLPTLQMDQGSYVQWYLAAMANAGGAGYVVTFHGNTFVVDSHRVDSLELAPGVATVAEMRPPVKGLWLLRSGTSDLYDRGVTALYDVIETTTA
jgi:hypothetical protein